MSEINEEKEEKPAWQLALEATDRYNGFSGGFTASNQDAVNAAESAYFNRPDFKYDMNGDALYQQYKGSFMRQGKLAMEDTIAKASAMTGGYGNSYAATAGQQAYQGSLEGLNDVIPELYQLAYGKYQDEGTELYNKYLIEKGKADDEYTRWLDEKDTAYDDMIYYQGLAAADSELAASEVLSLISSGYVMPSYDENGNLIAPTDDSTKYLSEDLIKRSGLSQEVIDAAILAVQDETPETTLDTEVIEKQLSGFETQGEVDTYLDGLVAKGLDEDTANYYRTLYAKPGNAQTFDQLQEKAKTFTNDKGVTNVNALISWLDSSNLNEEEYNTLYVNNTNATYRNTVAEMTAEDPDNTKGFSLLRSMFEYSNYYNNWDDWKVESDGGWNGGWGIDRNAVIYAPDGTKYTLDELYNALKGTTCTYGNGELSDKDAKAYVIKLQTVLGI